MKYTAPSFSVNPSGSYEQARAVCREHGHMHADLRGKCVRCGDKIGSEMIPDHDRE